jgi:hypothetical protein
VKHVPDWFPGAGFKQFAKIGRELFDVAVDGPLDYVKESLKVGPSMPRARISILGLTDGKANGSNPSVAASCFDRMAELTNQGFDESVIRAVTSTLYIGETDCRSHAQRYSLMTL